MLNILNIHQLPNNYTVFGGGDIIDNPRYYKKYKVLVWVATPAVYHYGTMGQLMGKTGDVIKEEQLYLFDGCSTLTLIPLNLPNSRGDYPSFVGQDKFK